MSEGSISQQRTKEEIERHWEESKKILEPEWGQILELMDRHDTSCKTLGKGDPEAISKAAEIQNSPAFKEKLEKFVASMRGY
jgi:predicted nucleic acid-binding protein